MVAVVHSVQGVLLDIFLKLSASLKSLSLGIEHLSLAAGFSKCNSHCPDVGHCSVCIYVHSYITLQTRSPWLSFSLSLTLSVDSLLWNVYCCLSTPTPFFSRTLKLSSRQKTSLSTIGLCLCDVCGAFVVVVVRTASRVATE